MKTWQIKIVFSDGEYSKTVHATSADQAKHLAICAARMASAGPTYYGHIISSTVTEQA